MCLFKARSVLCLPKDKQHNMPKTFSKMLTPGGQNWFLTYVTQL